MLPWIFQYDFPWALVALVLALILVATVLRPRLRELQKSCFASVFSRYIAPWLTRCLEPAKKGLFADLKSVTKSPRILEIGAGSGTNLHYLPPGTRLVALEPNRHFWSTFVKSCARFPDLTLEKLVQGQVEDMSMIDDCSFDVVVCTHVLCSVSRKSQALKEIKRVLIPGGKFVYVEHIGYKNNPAWLIQKFTEPLWSLLADGCKLTCNTQELIRHAGFTHVDHKIVNISKLAYVVKPHVLGIATK